ncbi:type VI secretion system baseplate subunit TssK, partial [Enterobacter ludwigii]|uniref:type VI secretion system baseplate subunit TssK n=1 Tax=Enterobacter ludwigii TaxID=299767 RepID=UPI003F6E695E
SLKVERLQAQHLSVRFQDGTLIDTSNTDTPAPVLALEGLTGEVVVLLALPLLRSGESNCLLAEERAERPARYRQQWRDVRDQYGDGTRQITVLQHEVSLRLASQDNSEYLTCPVARLRRESQGHWVLDETFLPPLLNMQASPWLTNGLGRLLTQLRSRLQRLMSMRRESNERMADFAVADVSLFWLLNALNGAEPLLASFLRFSRSPPERLWPVLAQLAGNLLTFSLEHQVSLIPQYDHGQPENVFPVLFDLLSDLLEASLPSRVIKIELTFDNRLHQWHADVRDPRLREGADWYLSVRSSMPLAQLQEHFPRQCKAGCPDDVTGLVNASRQGIPLLLLHHVPAAVPLRMENQYFSLDLSCLAAQSMLDSGHCVFYTPGTLGEPELELFVVLRT